MYLTTGRSYYTNIRYMRQMIRAEWILDIFQITRWKIQWYDIQTGVNIITTFKMHILPHIHPGYIMMYNAQLRTRVCVWPRDTLSFYNPLLIDHHVLMYTVTCLSGWSALHFYRYLFTITVLWCLSSKLAQLGHPVFPAPHLSLVVPQVCDCKIYAPHT